jgi:hypothetical protein
VLDHDPILPALRDQLHIPKTLESAHFLGYWMSAEMKECKTKWKNHITLFLHSEDIEVMTTSNVRLRELWQHIRKPRTALDSMPKRTTQDKTKHQPKHVAQHPKSSLQHSVKTSLFTTPKPTPVTNTDPTRLEEVNLKNFTLQKKPHSAETIILDTAYSLLQPMNLQLPNFDAADWGHHNVKGNGNCLVNACAYALLGDESKAANLRVSISNFVSKRRSDLFVMRSTHLEPYNLTMEILDNMTKNESVESPFFVFQSHEKLTDQQLDERLTLFYILLIHQDMACMDFMTDQYAQWINEIYIEYSLGKHKKSASEGSDTHILLYFLCFMYDVGFVMWINASMRPDVLHVTYSHTIHRNLKHGNTTTIFPFIHILNTPMDHYLQGEKYHMEHFSLLLPFNQMYTTYTPECIQINNDNNVSIPHLIYNPTKTISDIYYHLVSYDILLKLIYRTIKSRFSIRDFHAHVERVKAVMEYIDNTTSSTQDPYPDITPTVYAHRVLYRLLLVANIQFR